MNKRGQFYIVTAIIIGLIISSLSSMTTYAYIKSQPITIKDISSDLKEETPKIIDYGTYNNEDLYSIMHNFTTGDFAAYFLQKTDYTNATFIYGNKENLYRVDYLKGLSGTIKLGDSSLIEVKNSKIFEENITIKNKGKDYIDVEILKKKHQFKLKDNEMFYFIIAKEKDGEIYIEKN